MKMSEGCSMQITTKLNRNYFSVYVGSIVALISVSYFYRFHFLTVAFGYGLGCLICYIGLNSTFLNVVIDKLMKNYAANTTETPTEYVAPKGCVTCGSKECPRHDNGAMQEPWVGLRIHKQLDQAIEEFYNTILEEFVSTWYNKISLQPFFVDELRFQLRYASACLLRRAVKINYAHFITERLIPCALHHYTVWSDIAAAGVPLVGKMAVHPAAANRKAELNYLRSVTNALMPYVLKNNDVDNSVFQVLIREIISGWVFLPLTDVLADPLILNSLIILATGDETMAELPVSPDYHVEFLETFARQSDSVYSQRSKLLKLELDSVLEDQELFYALMQYLKSTAHIYTLQFYKDIKSFQTKLLNPVLCETELNTLKAEAKDIYLTYFDESSPTKINLDPSLVLEMKELLLESDDSVKKLQTSKALYQAARVSHAVLEKVLLPKFLHSEEFYSIFIGSRVSTGYHKLMTKKPQDKLMQTALKLGRNKSALKYTLDGQVLDSTTDETDEENMDILKYLDALASEHTLEHDLTCFKVVLTDVEIVMQAPPRRGPVRVFTLCVHYCPGGGSGGPAARLQRLKRSEHDFHLLHTKLHEFHALHASNTAHLPSRRDNSPLETLRYKYEDYLQQLLQQNILQTSELLYLFLTTESDFSLAVQASSLAANSTDLINIYQSVAHRLKKEKGQHLEGFLKNFLFSSDMERYQAIKQGIEEAQEVSEDASSLLQPPPATERRGNKCPHIESEVFCNNFGVEPNIVAHENTTCQRVVCGPMDCLLYAMLKVLDCPTVLIAVVGHVVRLGRQFADMLLNSYLDRTLRNLLTQRRLAHLIRLGHAVIFDKKPSSIRREDGDIRLALARAQLQACIPTAVNILTGAKAVAERVVQLIQQPHVNKQLVYELLDLCLLELFPELNQQDEDVATVRNETSS